AYPADLLRHRASPPVVPSARALWAAWFATPHRNSLVAAVPKFRRYGGEADMPRAARVCRSNATDLALTLAALANACQIVNSFRYRWLTCTSPVSSNAIWLCQRMLK